MEIGLCRCRRWKAKSSGLHSLRHGRVSVLRSHGCPDDLVKEWIGHSSLRTTSKYTHFTNQFRTEVVDSLALQ
ncbi:MAG: tyrosine-type recombinase/integrase [Terriglobia bacterium]